MICNHLKFKMGEMKKGKRNDGLPDVIVKVVEYIELILKKKTF